MKSPKPEFMKRQSEVHLLMTSEERAAVEREAQRHGMTLSAWVRHVLRPKLGLEVATSEPSSS